MSDKYKIWNKEKPEDYLFSSARSYAGLDAYLDIVCVGHKPLMQR